MADLKRVERLHGEAPIDWTLAQSVDSHCDHIVARNGLQSAQAEISARYGREVRARRAQRPDQLRAALANACAERKRIESENAVLRQRLREIESKGKENSERPFSGPLAKTIKR